MLGVLLLVAGGAQVAVAVLARDWDGSYLFMLTFTDFARNNSVREWG
jgi:hypothetical protein